MMLRIVLLGLVLAMSTANKDPDFQRYMTYQRPPSSGGDQELLRVKFAQCLSAYRDFYCRKVASGFWKVYVEPNCPQEPEAPSYPPKYQTSTYAPYPTSTYASYPTSTYAPYTTTTYAPPPAYPTYPSYPQPSVPSYPQPQQYHQPQPYQSYMSQPYSLFAPHEFFRFKRQVQRTQYPVYDQLQPKKLEVTDSMVQECIASFINYACGGGRKDAFFDELSKQEELYCGQKYQPKPYSLFHDGNQK